MTIATKLPTGDDSLLDQAIAEFLRAEAAGNAGDGQAWLIRYPGCARELAEFFDDRQRLHGLLAPLRPPVDSPGGRESTGLFHLPTPGSGEIDTVELAPKPPSIHAARYRPLSFHARGGMGEVWLADDERIGRRVAVKKLRPGRESPQARFLLEAQVTGQLEHPGVVPVHDLGIDEEGQPYYVMKFIEGRSLRAAITEYRDQRSAGDWPRDLAFLRLLEAFVDVCNAVAYAHSKGVLHRDVKPDNVMIGPYGETLLLDWGLAKIIGQPEIPGNTSVRLSGDASTATQDGAIVGSPLYMSPEGAEGRGEAIDHRSDVYLLGATLYEILTGRPPRQGTSQWELIDQARKSSPPPPRQVDPHVPPALEAICLKAMVFQKEDRYDSPIALAEEVQRFLAGEPIAAYREPLLARTRRWMRRHRRGLTRVAIGALVLTLCGLAFGSLQRARELTAREEARTRLIQFHRLADEAQFFAANTDAVAERAPYYAPERAITVGTTAIELVAQWGSDSQGCPLVEERPQLIEARYRLILLLAQVQSQSNKDPVVAQRVIELLDQAEAIRPRSTAIFELRSDCLQRPGEQDAAARVAAEEAKLAQPMTAHDQFVKGERLRLLDAGEARPDDPLVDRAQRARNLTAALEQYRQAVRLDPRHYWAHYQMGRCLLALGHRDEAAQALGACLALRPDVPWAYSTRGLASALAGQPAEAVADLNRALELDPDFRPARVNRGVVRWLAGETDAALVDFDAALAPPREKRLVEAALYRGQLLLAKSRVPQALADLNAAIDEAPGLRQAYWLRAQAHFQLGDDRAGISDLKQFLVLAEPLSKLPDVLALGRTLRLLALQLDATVKPHVLRLAEVELQRLIAGGDATVEAYQHLGAVQELLSQSDEAIESYSRGLAVEPTHLSLRNLRGWCYAMLGKRELARADFEQAIRNVPNNAEAHAGLGYVFAIGGDVVQARQQAAAALLHGAGNYLVLHNVACIYGELSRTVIECREEYENLALAALEREVSLSREAQGGPDALELIRFETAFPASLRSRLEFDRLPSGKRK